MSQQLDLSEFLNGANDAVLIDVRSEGEYAQGHLPGSINLPLLNNEERKIVGTTYKKEGREAAVLKGMELVGHKFAGYVKASQQLAPSRKVAVYCWRGGMRSNIMCWLLTLSGFKVHVLKGGYKVFRNWALDVLKEERKVLVLGGKTCTGKTELLQELKVRGESIIDLEKIACHKGSTFGALGQDKQPSNEQFENLLALQWNTFRDSPVLWLENESNRIGGVKIPDVVYSLMRKSPVIEVSLPLEERIKRVLLEYGEFPMEQLEEATKRLEKRLGNLRMREAIEFLKQNNKAEWARMLLEYYDDAYEYSSSKREPGSIYKGDIAEVDSNKTVEELIRMSKTIYAGS